MKHLSLQRQMMIATRITSGRGDENFSIDDQIKLARPPTPGSTKFTTLKEYKKWPDPGSR